MKPNPSTSELLKSYFAGLSGMNVPGEQIESFVSSVLKGNGSTFFTGLGKSFAVAQKASTQFRSIGLRSFSFQLEDLLHGELGAIRKGDTIVVVSKSGSADQLPKLKSFSQANNSTLVGFLSSTDPTGIFDLVIASGIAQELEPYPFLPTLSLTATEILLDICLIKLANLKALNETEFYRYHPNGGLGSNLGKPAREIYTKDVSGITVLDTDTSGKVYETMGAGKRGYCLVVSASSGSFLGVITDGDLRRLAATEDGRGIQPQAAINKNPVIVGPETQIHEVASIFRKSLGLRFIPVVEDNKLVGVIERNSNEELFARG